MTIAMQPIYTQTVGAGGAASITFNNIPQTFTDLKLVVSGRSSAIGAIVVNTLLRLNADTTNTYSMTRFYGNGSAAFTDRQSSTGPNFDAINTSSSISNTFNNSEYYFANYTSSNYKQFINDAVLENNSTEAYPLLESGLWRSTSAITSINIGPNFGNWVQHSTFTLYGITKG